MAETQAEQQIVQILMSEPHIAGRRISVVQIQEWVEGRGLTPTTVADRYDLDLAAVYAALAYYHQHPREMQAIHTQRAEAFEELREEIERPPDVDPDAVEISVR
jgi:uncharacterized protein (DUF433 family)